ncbi:DUF2771 family protein [Gordonia insulae]|uniref:DUF2771 domain-containing protein n=1 Tax=Gordonia insulae TaxID=2420509 RepID=A0A3G8JKM8_9ACTN|nr:DUF2771 family protein [Gordonia insulae]AZG45596.1 hypothetical protein D7316_02192 [Gordonia insulae]
MYVNSAEKKTLAIIAAVILAFVVIVGGAVALLTKDTWSGDAADDDHAYLQLAVGDQLVRVEPTRMCDVLLKNCEPANVSDITVQRVPVPVGESVMLSVSEDIAKWPWNLVIQYLTPQGLDGTSVPMRSNSTYTTVLHSTRDRILVNIEVQVPSAISDAANNNVIARGYLAADTTPDDLEVPNPDLR